MTKQSHLCVFSTQKYKRNPDPKIEKLSHVWGLRRHIIDNKLPTHPPKKPTTNQQKITFPTTNQSHFWPFFVSKDFQKTATTHSPKTFSHQLLSGNLVPKGRKAISAGSSAKGPEPAVNPRAGLVGFPSLWLVNLCQPI